MKIIDPLFQTKHRFVIYIDGNPLGEVFVLGGRYILARNVRRGLSCVRAVGT